MPPAHAAGACQAHMHTWAPVSVHACTLRCRCPMQMHTWAPVSHAHAHLGSEVCMYGGDRRPRVHVRLALYPTLLPELCQAQATLPGGSYDATCVIVSRIVYHTALSERPKFRQHNIIHQARIFDASRIIVAGQVYHTVLPELVRAQATPYSTPRP